MHSTEKTQAAAHRYGHFLRLGLVLVVALVAGGLGAAGCLDRPLCSVKKQANGTLIEDCRPQTTNLFVDTIQNKTVDKIDLLFMIDNSSSMADKQAVLAKAVPDLVNRLVNPICVTKDGVPDGQTPGDPSQACPNPNDAREFNPIGNIHIGIVTSSLGSHGASLCVPGMGSNAPDVDDNGELLGSLQRGAAAVYPPGNNSNAGFLDWNPSKYGGAESNPTAFNAAFANMVIATGQIGCGLEAQLEAVYRFVADPFPPQNVQLQTCHGGAMCAVPTGIDQKLLAQRAAFFRADSLVAIIMLTDENDCSIRDSDQFYFDADLSINLPKSSSACGTNPNDPCCYSCALAPPQGCTPDPSCKDAMGNIVYLTQAQDKGNLRCFEQLRRFGIDFLYPVKRYVNALTQTQLCTTVKDLQPVQNCPARQDGKPGLVANPLFQDLSGQGGIGRDPSLVFLAGITGVPWQLIATDATSPDLHYKTKSQMDSDNTWAVILGDSNPGPASGPVYATDSHMQESIDPRPGLPGFTSPPTADPINGHEWNISQRDDLQYACIFPKPPTADLNCTDPNQCDCFKRPATDANPLCADPATGQYSGTQQFKAKAYPCLRELQLLHDFGSNAIVASLCARNLTDDTKQDFGYRPAVDAIVERLKEALTGKCLPRKLQVAADGTVPCSILEGTTNPAESVCDPTKNRTPAAPNLVQPALDVLSAQSLCDNDPNTPTPNCNQFHFCELGQAKIGGASGQPDPGCAQGTKTAGSFGWCYVDPFGNPAIGNPALVKNCPLNEQQLINFTGDNTPARDGVVLIACLGAPVGGGATPTATATMMPPAGGDAATP